MELHGYHLEHLEPPEGREAGKALPEPAEDLACLHLALRPLVSTMRGEPLLSTPACGHLLLWPPDTNTGKHTSPQ